MKKKYKKAAFRSPSYVDLVIVDDAGELVGTQRLKPWSIGFKRKGARKFATKPWAEFECWIMTGVPKAH